MPSPRVLAFDAGGTKLLGGVVDADGHVHERVRLPIAGASGEELLDVFAESAERLRAGAGEVVAAGYGIPSLIDRARGLSVSSVHLPLDEVAFGRLMEERLGLPVAWDNDTNLALLAEHRLGAARGCSEAVMLTIGTGIGGAMVLRGELYRGAVGAAGELGHMTVDLDGPPCLGDCPGRGCLEAVASGTAIGREGAAAAAAAPESALGRAVAGGRPPVGELVTELARAGDATARSVLELAGRRLGAGLVSLAHVFNPEVIVLGGGAMAAGDLLLDPARDVLAERGLAPSRDVVRVVAASLGDEAGMIGAALAAHELVAGDPEGAAWR
jgi:glucokinase